jgi:hypothetical protein
MALIIASEAQLNAFLEQDQRLRDKSPGGMQHAVDLIEQRRRSLTEDTPASREQVAIGNGEPLTDKSVRGVQHAIDVIEASDPYGLRTQLPMHVEELARLKDTSFSGIQGATALIRIVEKREPLTDTTVRGHNRAEQVMASTAPIAYTIEPKAAPKSEPSKVEGWMDKIASTLAKAKDTVRSWLPF